MEPALIPPEYLVPLQFDRSMARAFNTQVTAKATLKGKLDVYRYFDNVRFFLYVSLALTLLFIIPFHQ